MKIAIVGAGFTGLAAAYDLSREGHQVTVFEKESEPGGLALGYQEKNWEWTLEQHYHHWFTSDDAVLTLAKEVGQEVIIKRPKTCVYINGKNYQLDSPVAFLTFPLLPLIDRLRMIVTLGLLRINPWWQPLEKIQATKVLPILMGKKAWDLVWKPQLVNKMGDYADDISLVWFWTRINKRSPSLAYPEGGFLHFARKIAAAITAQRGIIHYDCLINEIHDGKVTTITYTKQKKTHTETFDRVIVTLPTALFLKVAPQLPQAYSNKLQRLQSLGATNMVLRLKKPLMTDGTYWLSIAELPSPALVVVEHTNLMDKKNYDNEHLVYVGNYLKTTDSGYTATDAELLKRYDPLLEKINPNYKKSLIGYRVFHAPFAQPIVPTNYSRHIPDFKTPLPHVFLANIEQVYPWDRGTNYAVVLGKKITKIATE